MPRSAQHKYRVEQGVQEATRATPPPTIAVDHSVTPLPEVLCQNSGERHVRPIGSRRTWADAGIGGLCGADCLPSSPYSPSAVNRRIHLCAVVCDMPISAGTCATVRPEQRVVGQWLSALIGQSGITGASMAFIKTEWVMPRPVRKPGSCGKCRRGTSRTARCRGGGQGGGELAYESFCGLYLCRNRYGRKNRAGRRTRTGSRPVNLSVSASGRGVHHGSRCRGFRRRGCPCPGPRRSVLRARRRRRRPAAPPCAGRSVLGSVLTWAPGPADPSAARADAGAGSGQRSVSCGRTSRSAWARVRAMRTALAWSGPWAQARARSGGLP